MRNVTQPDRGNSSSGLRPGRRFGDACPAHSGFARGVGHSYDRCGFRHLAAPQAPMARPVSQVGHNYDRPGSGAESGHENESVIVMTEAGEARRHHEKRRPRRRTDGCSGVALPPSPPLFWAGAFGIRPTLGVFLENGKNSLADSLHLASVDASSHLDRHLSSIRAL